MAATSDTALVTYPELVEWSGGSLDAIEEDEGLSERALWAAQDLADRYNKGVKWFVTQYVEDWRNDSRVRVAGASYESMYGRNWPIVEVDTANVELYTRDNEVIRMYATTVPDNDVTYYAGYRREEQALGDLQALTTLNLDTLGSVPSATPEWLTAAICEVAILMVGRASMGHVYSNDITQAIGSAETVTLRLPAGEANNIFERYVPHRAGVLWV